MSNRDLLYVVQDIFLLALVAWREARWEPRDGKLAVCWAINNRVMNPKWWGHDVPTVVFKKWQFSSMTDPNDPQLKLLPTPYEAKGWAAWQECMDVAMESYFRTSGHPALGADSYYAVSIPPPKWAVQSRFVVQIGNHRFYDLDDDYERPVVGEPPPVA